MDAKERRQQWRELGLEEVEMDRLERYRSVPALPPARVSRLRSRLDALSGQRVSWSSLMYLAWMAIRLNPGGAVGASLGLMVLGGALAHVHPATAPALWAVVAPWMAIGVALFGRGPRAGALGDWARQAPVAWGAVRLATWGILSGFDAILLLLLVAGGLGVGPALAVLGQWFGPFLITLAVALGCDRLFPPGISRVVLVGGLSVNSAVGLVGWAGGRALAPVQAILVAGGQVAIPLALFVILAVALLQVSRPVDG